MKKQKLVSIWNPKGGQGKSLIAINLAAAAVEMGLKALVICQDPQGTSSAYYDEGNLPFAVIKKPPNERPDADIIILDHQASDWEVPKTQLIVMPLKPARDQYATYITAYARATEKGKDILTVVTDGQSHRLSEEATMKRLKEEGAIVIPSSGVFSRAAQEYRTIFDPELNRAYKIRDRRQDFQHLLARILMDDERGAASTSKELSHA